MSRPLVTAIITNFNYARLLPDAIESALAQSYPDMEIVVVDDGSSDDSRDVIASFGDSITALFQDNGGQAKAFEAGIEAARGELICLLDADDVWRSAKVERVVEAGWDRGSVLTYHRVQRVDASLHPWGRTVPRATKFRNLAGRARRSGGWWSFPPTSALSFRKSYLTRLRPFPEAYRICADAYLAQVAPYVGTVTGISEPLALYRLHGKNGWSGAMEEKERLERRAAMYRLNVVELNRSLEQLGLQGLVDLKHHWPNRAVNCELAGEMRLGDALLGLRFPAEKNVLRRGRDVARVAYRVYRQKAHTR